MTQKAFTADEFMLLRSLVAKELKEFIREEPEEAEPILLKGEAGYEEFLRQLLAKLGAGRKQA